MTEGARQDGPLTMGVENDSFQQMVEMLPQIVWATNAQGTVEYVNSQWCHYTGLTLEQSLGNRPVSFIHPQDQATVLTNWEDSVRAEQPFETEMRLRRADGEYEWFLCRCLPVYDGQTRGSGRKVVRWIGTSTNINRRKLIEENQQFAGDLVVELRRMRDPNQIAGRLVSALGAYLNLSVCALVQHDTATDQTYLLAAYGAPSLGARLHVEMDPDPIASIHFLEPDQWQQIGRVLAARMEAAGEPLALSELSGISEFQDWAYQAITPEALLRDAAGMTHFYVDQGHAWTTVGSTTVGSEDGAANSDAGGAEPADKASDVKTSALIRVRPAALIAATATSAWQGNESIKVYLVGMQTVPHRWHTYEQNLFQALAGSAWLAYQRSVTELELRRQQEAFEFALDMAAMGTWEYDYSTGIVARSASLDRIFGLSESGLGPAGERDVNDYYDLVHPEDLPALREAVETARYGNAPFAVEYRIVRPDGRVVWVAGRGAVVRRTRTRELFLSGALVDITERKKLEAEIHTRAELAQFQASVGTILTGSDDLQTLMQRVVEAAVDALDATFARIWTLDEAEGVLELRASAGLYTRLDGDHSRIPLGQYKIGRIAAEGIPHVTNDVVNDPLLRDREWAMREGMQAFAGYPLVIEGHVVGVIAVFARHALSQQTLQALLAVSNKLALTIERKRTEASLRESEERFRIALDDSPITVYTTDTDLRYTWIFNAPAKLSEEAMLGKRDDEVYTPEGAADLMRFKREVLAARQLMRRVVEVADKYDYARYDITAVPVFDRDGTPIGLTVAAADITERERAETRLAFLAEASELLSGSLDYNETLERLAQAVVPRLANWCAVELVENGELKQVVVAHEDPEMVRLAQDLRSKYPASLDDPQGVAQVIRSGRPEFYPYISEELLRASARDDEHWETIQKVGMRSAIVVPLRLRERILGAMTLVWSDSRRNYTEADLRFAEELARRAAVAIENARLYREARTAESDLRRLNETLEQRVTERTAELERSNQELDRFAYVASHDLKAPLRAIDHLANWVAEDAGSLLPPASVEHLDKMRGRILRMESLLDDLLTYSRAGRVRGDASIVNTGDLLRSVVETVSPPDGFHIVVPEDLPTLETYRAPFEAVFRNLIGNAIKHHPHRNGTVSIEWEDAGDFVEFCVADDGEGIRPEFHERIFEMFQTLRPRDHVEGSGIGLAVVKKIIESGGGTIRVESSPGQGARFCFTWPKVWRG